MEYSGFYDFEVKELAESGVITGYASTFGGPPDLQGDVIAPGAFTGTIAKTKSKLPMLMAHNGGRVIGFITEASEDKHGLLVRGEFTLQSSDGRDAYAIVQHAAQLKQPFGMSIGYDIPENGAEYDERTRTRTLKKINLYEISLAAVPANPRARVRTVKAFGDWTIREFEEYLRDGGFSQEAAKRIAASGFKALDQRDVDEGEGRAAEGFMSELRSISLLHAMKGI